MLAYWGTSAFFNSLFVLHQSVWLPLVLSQTKLKLFHRTVFHQIKKNTFWSHRTIPEVMMWNNFSFHQRHVHSECLQGFCFWKEAAASCHGPPSFQPLSLYRVTFDTRVEQSGQILQRNTRFPLLKGVKPLFQKQTPMADKCTELSSKFADQMCVFSPH